VPWGEQLEGDRGTGVKSSKTARSKGAGRRTSSSVGSGRRTAVVGGRDTPPWPGCLPPPSPALVHPVPVPVEVLGPDGILVGVTGRGRCTAVPSSLVLPTTGDSSVGITGWAGPWPADERWWDPAAARRRARLQVLLDDGTAHLLVLERGRWSLEATYD
jgi:protein ImuB